jgi:hypothetical protein
MYNFKSNFGLVFSTLCVLYDILILQNSECEKGPIKFLLYISLYVFVFGCLKMA